MGRAAGPTADGRGPYRGRPRTWSLQSGQQRRHCFREHVSRETSPSHAQVSSKRAWACSSLRRRVGIACALAPKGIGQPEPHWAPSRRLVDPPIRRTQVRASGTDPGCFPSTRSSETNPTNESRRTAVCGARAGPLGSPGSRGSGQPWSPSPRASALRREPLGERRAGRPDHPAHLTAWETNRSPCRHALARSVRCSWSHTSPPSRPSMAPAVRRLAGRVDEEPIENEKLVSRMGDLPEARVSRVADETGRPPTAVRLANPTPCIANRRSDFIEAFTPRRREVHAT